MTQEQKAKRYDEVLTNARMFYKDEHVSDDANNLLEALFPELAESKDERIRKVIYGWIYTQPSQFFDNGFSKEEMLAWIEKQGQKPIDPDTLIQQRVDVLADMVAEQEAAWSEEDETGLTNTIIMLKEGASLHFSKKDIAKAVDWLKSIKDRAQPQPEQEWSEEDEKIYQSIMDDTVQENQLNSNQTNWLRDIKYRYFQQPKQEWSKEDEKHSSYICAALDCYYRLREDRNNTNGQEDLDKARNWLHNKLKSLRPQSIWKPSEEQLKSLQEVIDVGHFTSYPNSLETLYEQLKKLKG